MNSVVSSFFLFFLFSLFSLAPLVSALCASDKDCNNAGTCTSAFVCSCRYGRFELNGDSSRSPAVPAALATCAASAKDLYGPWYLGHRIILTITWGSVFLFSFYAFRAFSRVERISFHTESTGIFLLIVLSSCVKTFFNAADPLAVENSFSSIGSQALEYFPDTFLLMAFFLLWNHFRSGIMLSPIIEDFQYNFLASTRRWTKWFFTAFFLFVLLLSLVGANSTENDDYYRVLRVYWCFMGIFLLSYLGFLLWAFLALSYADSRLLKGNTVIPGNNRTIKQQQKKDIENGILQNDREINQLASPGGGGHSRGLGSGNFNMPTPLMPNGSGSTADENVQPQGLSIQLNNAPLAVPVGAGGRRRSVSAKQYNPDRPNVFRMLLVHSTFAVSLTILYWIYAGFGLETTALSSIVLRFFREFLWSLWCFAFYFSVWPSKRAVIKVARRKSSAGMNHAALMQLATIQAMQMEVQQAQAQAEGVLVAGSSDGTGSVRMQGVDPTASFTGAAMNALTAEFHNAQGGEPTQPLPPEVLNAMNAAAAAAAAQIAAGIGPDESESEDDEDLESRSALLSPQAKANEVLVAAHLIEQSFKEQQPTGAMTPKSRAAMPATNLLRRLSVSSQVLGLHDAAHSAITTPGLFNMSRRGSLTVGAPHLGTGIPFANMHLPPHLANIAVAQGLGSLKGRHSGTSTPLTRGIPNVAAAAAAHLNANISSGPNSPHGRSHLVVRKPAFSTSESAPSQNQNSDFGNASPPNGNTGGSLIVPNIATAALPESAAAPSPVMVPGSIQQGRSTAGMNPMSLNGPSSTLLIATGSRPDDVGDRQRSPQNSSPASPASRNS